MRIRASLLGALVIVGFLLTATATASQPTRSGAESRRDQLVSLIETRRTEIDDLDDEVASLRESVSGAQRELADQTDLDPAELEATQRAAGLTPVEGPGLVVTVDDPNPALSEDARVVPFQVVDRDLQELTNALWAAGAEAIEVNDERLVSTTAIRNGGDTITVNFRPVTPPYEIVAVGVDVDEFARSEIVQQFERWSDQFGVDFSFEPSSDLEVGEYVGRSRLRYARPLESSGG